MDLLSIHLAGPGDRAAWDHYVLRHPHVHLPGWPGMLVSLPYCDAGGLLADSAGIERTLLDHALAYSRNRRIPCLGIRSVRPFAAKACCRWHHFVPPMRCLHTLGIFSAAF